MIEKSGVEDEVLELVWTRMEKKSGGGSGEGGLMREELLRSRDPEVSDQLLEKMMRDGHLCESRGRIDFTEKGRQAASRLIRSHRLAERLFNDVLGMEKRFMEANACVFEHILSREVTESICTLLGHPRECPHGHPIPRGSCCEREVQQVDRIVLPLSELRAGQSGRIVYVASKLHSRLDQLTSLGVSPGEEIRVHQTFPSFMIKVGETDIALDGEIAGDVYVRWAR